MIIGLDRWGLLTTPISDEIHLDNILEGSFTFYANK